MEASTGDAGLSEPIWGSFGNDLAQSRVNRSETSLTPETAQTLGRAWHIDAPGVTSTPAVADGIVYWADWEGGVNATRASEGSEVWRKTFEAGFTSSPAIVGHRLILSDRRADVLALDRRDGDVLWRQTVNDSPHTQLWSSPVVADGVLVIGVGGQGTQQASMPLPEEQLRSFRGAIVGLDVETGERLWRFETTIGPDGTEYGEGVGSWSSAAVDLERGLAFIGTGNAYFAPPSPYTDSLLALDVRTGELEWATQFTSDVFRSGGGPGNGPDFDVGAAPNLFTANGRDLVGVGDKSGQYRALDRETGEIVWVAPLTTGSSIGGIMAPAVVVDDLIYVSSNQGGTQSRLYAIDTADGSVRWGRELTPMTFGTFSYANGVLVGGPVVGTLFAIDARDGTSLAELPLPAQRAGGVAIADGAVYTGSGMHFFNNASEPLMGGLTAFRIGLGGPADAGAPSDASVDAGPEPPRYALLSETGLYEDLASEALTAGVEPFEPEFQLWSDGADKRRWVQLPAGATIDTLSMDAWKLPVGTKVWKEFTRDGTRVETRLIERVSDTQWFFMPFVWRSDGTDAEATPGGLANAAGTEHDVPSVADCTVCHNGAPDHVLGFSAIQLAHSGPGVTLDSLASAGLLTNPPASPIVVPGDPTARAALGYLHANCGQCHNPMSPVSITVTAKFRLMVGSLAAVESTPTYISAVDIPPVAGGGGPTTNRIEPGNPEASTVYYRMGLRGEIGQMPPIATELVDADGRAAVAAWITSLSP